MSPFPYISVLGMCRGACPKDHYLADVDQQDAGLIFSLNGLGHISLMLLFMTLLLSKPALFHDVLIAFLSDS